MPANAICNTRGTDEGELHAHFAGLLLATKVDDFVLTAARAAHRIGAQERGVERVVLVVGIEVLGGRTHLPVVNQLVVGLVGLLVVVADAAGVDQRADAPLDVILFTGVEDVRTVAAKADSSNRHTNIICAWR